MSDQIETAITRAMSWHPSENGPSYNEVRSAVEATINGEIERLRFELKAAHNEIEIADYVIEQSKAENAKLRAVLEQIAKKYEDQNMSHLGFRLWVRNAVATALTQQDKR